MCESRDKQDPKIVWITWHTRVLLISVLFHWKSNFAISRNKDTDFISLKIVLIKMVIILMMSAKLATLAFLKIKLFWNQGYDVIISVPEVTNKILWRDSNYIADFVKWPKMGNSSHFYKRSFHNLNFIRIWPKTPLFWRGGLGSSSII